MAFNENNINAAKADISTEQPTYQKNATLELNTRNINAAGSDVTTNQPTYQKNATLELNTRNINAAGSDVTTNQPTKNTIVSLIFYENNLKSGQASIQPAEKNLYPNYNIREIIQPGNTFQETETKFYVDKSLYDSDFPLPSEILLSSGGVTYNELLNLVNKYYPDFKLVHDENNNIIGIRFFNVYFVFRI